MYSCLHNNQHFNFPHRFFPYNFFFLSPFASLLSCLFHCKSLQIFYSYEQQKKNKNESKTRMENNNKTLRYRSKIKCKENSKISYIILLCCVIIKYYSINRKFIPYFPLCVGFKIISRHFCVCVS